MILGLEIVLTLGGLYMLIMGKGWGKGSPSHWCFRLLGLFAMSVIPAVVVAAFTLGIVWAITHPSATEQEMQQDMHWPAVGLEVGMVIVWAIIAAVWDNKLRKRLATPVQPTPIV